MIVLCLYKRSTIDPKFHYNTESQKVSRLDDDLFMNKTIKYFPYSNDKNNLV